VISAGELEQAKQAAGIEDCPTSDSAVPAVDSGLPDVVLSCLGGGRDVRLAGLRGRPMMINIWAQWCQPCQDEAPFIAEVANANDSDLMILGVDYEDPRPDRAIEFARVLTWRFPQLVDQDKVLSGPLQITGPPQTFFVRADGTIAGRHVGPFRSAEQIRSQAKEYLGVVL
jgi:thiol-disulfide isomerase/thioredoxin